VHKQACSALITGSTNTHARKQTQHNYLERLFERRVLKEEEPQARADLLGNILQEQQTQLQKPGRGTAGWCVELAQQPIQPFGCQHEGGVSAL